MPSPFAVNLLSTMQVPGFCGRRCHVKTVLTVP